MTDFLLTAFVFLCAGVIAVPLATRFGLGSVLGYLIAGIAISPLLTLLHVDVISLQHFAEFGVVMMLFLVGLELNPTKLWEMRRKLLGLGGLQVAGTAAVVTAIAMALGQPWRIALAIGLVLSLSSTAIVLQTLNEKGLMKSDGGQASFSVLLFQDIAVIPMLALIPLLAMPGLQDATPGQADHGEEAAHGLSLVEGLNAWQTAGVTVLAIAFVLVIGTYLARPLFRYIASAQLRELFTATALFLVIGIALLMSLVGVSPALGTFLAGVVLANSEYRHELESDIDPFKGLLLGLFFMTVGAGIDFDLLFDQFGTVLGLTLGLIVVKGLVLGALAYLFEIRGSDKWLTTIGLAQAGEFGFVLLSFTVANSVIPGDTANLLMLVVALSMILTPAMFIAFDRLVVPFYAKQADGGMDDIEVQGDAIIIGHGRVGGIVNRMMRAVGYETTVVDYSSSQLEMLRTFGFRVFFGDGTRPDLLKAAGIEDAKLVVVAINDKDHITNVVRYIIKTYPHVHVIARAVDRIHVFDLWYVGCRDVIRETYDSSIRMARSALEAMGIPQDKAVSMAKAFETKDRASMPILAELYDMTIPVMENKPYVEKVKELSEEWEAQLKGKMQRLRDGEEEQD
ncbi:monovalent cation:proton antiporter-2 (CPA2) family protein [Saccharospirillum salsuginis]|uniref:Potassium transporter n=1 Tax=Saccharospirillum salsuginis TaxID=418750 RepID=A0A918N8K8_9GAMM|nr:monovalent cation:proton antiporter-2 (CPA2) family protein [Saccharospirillum salsuginis]GGX54117.1 potassium transporter [Saccharospirillum salsuginis]